MNYKVLHLLNWIQRSLIDLKINETKVTNRGSGFTIEFESEIRGKCEINLWNLKKNIELKECDNYDWLNLFLEIKKEIKKEY